MFDEFNEGNQICKTAETQADVPAGSGYLALDEDGTRCSADYYMRLTGDGGRMLKGQIALTAIRPTQPWIGGPPTPDVDLAAGRPTTQSSQTQHYGSGFAVDNDPHSYWESANNAFPQWLQVDLGAATSVGRVVLKLPATWGSRTQTLSVLGSTDGTTFNTTLKASAGYTFSPSTNTVTITFTATTTRYVRLNITANTGWPAGQISEFEVYAS